MEDITLNEVFAFELVNHVFISKGLMWFSNAASQHLNRDTFIFDRKVGEAVEAILKDNIVQVYNSYNEFYSKYKSPTTGVALFAFHLVPLYFLKGFSPESFLYFCSQLIGVSYLFFEVGHYEVPDTAAGMIGNILRAFTFTGEFKGCGGFAALVSASDKVLEKLKPKQSSREP